MRRLRQGLAARLMVDDVVDVREARMELVYRIKAALDLGLQAWRTAPAPAEQIRSAILEVDELVDSVLEEVADFIDAYVKAVLKVSKDLALDGYDEAPTPAKAEAFKQLRDLALLNVGGPYDEAVVLVAALIERTDRYTEANPERIT